MPGVTFHIGFPKTGTTTLQFAFARNPAVFYLGKNYRDPPAGLTDSRIAPSWHLAEQVYCADETRFAAALPGLRKVIDGALADEKAVFISDEAFTFVEYMPVGRSFGIQAISDHHFTAERLHRLAPEANVLVALREQKSFLASWYLQRRKGGTLKESFPDFFEAARRTVQTRSLLNALNYDEMLAAYTSRFGADRVRVVAFEQMRTDFSKFVALAAELCGIEPEEAVRIWGNAHNNTRQAVHPTLRRLNAVLPVSVRQWIPTGVERALAGMLPKVPDKLVLTPEQVAFIDDFYSASNGRTERLTGLDLGALGYATNGSAATPARSGVASDAPAAPGA